MAPECDGWHNKRECENEPTWLALGYISRFNVPLESRHCDSCKQHIERVGYGWSGGSVMFIPLKGKPDWVDFLTHAIVTKYLFLPDGYDRPLPLFYMDGIEAEFPDGMLPCLGLDEDTDTGHSLTREHAYGSMDAAKTIAKNRLDGHEYRILPLRINDEQKADLIKTPSASGSLAWGIFVKKETECPQTGKACSPECCEYPQPKPCQVVPALQEDGLQ